MSSPTPAAGGVIHDIGYQRYTGPRLGRGYATRSLYAHGLRSAFGLGRSAAAKIFPWGVLALLVMIAVVFAAIRAQTGLVVMPSWQFPASLVGGLFFWVLLFCAVAAPELVSRDLRSGVLPLYFSRPISRSDYPLAKFAALVSAVFLLLLAPLLVLFLGGAFGSADVSLVGDEVIEFSKGVLMAAIVALLYGSLSLLISSLSGRRAVASALTVGLILFTLPVVGVLHGIAWSQRMSEEGPTGAALQLEQLANLASPITLPTGVADWFFDDPFFDVGPYGPLYLAVLLGLVVVSLLLTLLRYRKVAR